MPADDGVRWDRLPLRSREAEARTLDAVRRAAEGNLEATLTGKRREKTQRNAPAVNHAAGNLQGLAAHYRARLAEAEAARRSAAKHMTKLTLLPQDQAEARLAAWQNTHDYIRQGKTYPHTAEEVEAQYMWQRSGRYEPDPFDAHMARQDPRIGKALENKHVRDGREVRAQAARAVMDRRSLNALAQRRTRNREQAPATPSIAQAASARSRGQAGGPSTTSGHSSGHRSSTAQAARPATSHHWSVRMPWSKSKSSNARR